MARTRLPLIPNAAAFESGAKLVVVQSGTEKLVPVAALPNSGFDVTAFGAVGSGLVECSAEIQNAVAACAAAGGGTVYFPPGTYLADTPITVPSNIRLLGFYATIISTATTDGAKIQIAGSDVVIEGLILNGAKSGTSGSGFFEYGLIDIVRDHATAFKNISIFRCTMRNSEGVGVRFLGNIDGLRIEKCVFTANWLDIFGEKAGTYVYKNVSIRQSDFSANWYTSTYSGAIKLKGDIDANLFPVNIDITENIIRSSAEMGIELFGGFKDSSIVNNQIDGLMFAISVNNGINVSVLNNKTWRTGYCGIEIAEASKHCLIALNTVESYSSGTTRGGNRGIIASGTFDCEDNFFVNNTVKGCYHTGIDIQTSQRTTLALNRIYDCEVLIAIKKSDYITAESNHLYGPCNFHFFLDITNKDCTDFDLCRNYLYGTAANDNLIYYRGETEWKLTNLRVYDNNLTAAFYTNLPFNKTIPDGDCPNLQCYNNYFVEGSGKSVWPDFTTNSASIPPFSAILQRAGISTAAKSSLAVPTDAAARWVKLQAIDLGNVVFLQAHFFAFNNTDGDSSAVSVIVSATPYGIGSRVTMLPNSPFTGIIEEVIANNPGSGSITEIWLKLKASPVKTWTIDCHFSDYPQHVVASPVLTTTEPTWASNSSRAGVDQYLRYRYNEFTTVADIDYGTASANAEQSTDIYVAGARTTGTPTVNVGFASAAPSGIVFVHARVSADDTVKITWRNVTGSSVSINTINTRVEVHQY